MVIVPWSLYFVKCVVTVFGWTLYFSGEMSYNSSQMAERDIPSLDIRMLELGGQLKVAAQRVRQAEGEVAGLGLNPTILRRFTDLWMRPGLGLR